MRKWCDNIADMAARKPSGWLGQFFNGTEVIRKQYFEYIVDKLELKPGDLFLEIGCGTGFLLKMALERRVQGAVGIDHSCSMVESAGNRNREAIGKGKLIVKLIDADSPPWPWPTEKFTCAASHNVFMYLEHPDMVLSEIHRLLKPSGRLLILNLSDCLANRIISKVFCLKFRLYKDRDMESLLYKAGFVKVEVKSNSLGRQKCYGCKP
jgi:ubiquinone/menaquinone biosynthesis C-methylase UbiE